MQEGNGARSFEDLRIWKESRLLVNEIYDAMRGIKDYSFKDQIQRAAISVMNNISEGFERRTPIEFARFLDIAKGSSGETRSMLYLAEDRRYIAANKCVDLRSRYQVLSSGISALTRTLKSK